ncbi:hypothetical protein [Candidatus Manganitrophus noduliformans]|uniref:Uncharacterized protein n=1 Tax=Candidatus Manganitrophus noduliformans TaxID=2606439 RepID=A0A7X6DMM8_9BACT|nr:hypothetical protein [Candidatus Manganitrophus noduliformans]NKE69902.1 hypothetical protein [Candidatus Manganitrophus noduliformans]
MVPDEEIIEEDTVVTCINVETGVDTKAEVISSEELSGQNIKVVLRDGVLGQAHKIETKIHTTLDNVLEQELILYIRRNPVDQDRFEKQPSEEYSIGNNFADELEPGDSIVSHSTLATKEADGSDATATVIKGDGLADTQVHLHVGVFSSFDGEYHLLEMRVVTAMGYKYAKQVTMITKER